MITERKHSNPRLVMHTWLQELRRGCIGERAPNTAAKIEDLSAAMLTMAASSEAADPQKMRALLDKDHYPALARNYMEKNWSLLAGMKPVSSEMTKHYNAKVSRAAGEAIQRLTDHVTASRPDSLEKIVAITEQVGKVLSNIPGSASAMHGDGTAILLREAIGLPGDEGVALMVRDDRVILNAALAIRRLGATIDLVPFAEKAGVVHQGRLSDWRVDGDVGAGDAPISEPVAIQVKANGDSSVDIFVGGAEEDGTLPGQSSIHVEREADTTRFMIYDANCDSPRVFGVRDGEPLEELPNDWEHTPRDDDPESGPGMG